MELINGLIEGYREMMERYRNGPLLEGTMAACALVATSDGRVSLAERVRVDQILETLDALKVFDPHEGVDLFIRFCDALLDHPQDGFEKAVTAIRAVSGPADTRQLLLRLCMAVSAVTSGNHFTDRAQLLMICALLGMEPESCGLTPEETETIDPSTLIDRLRAED